MSFQFTFKLVQVFRSSYYTRNGIPQFRRGNAEVKVPIRNGVCTLQLIEKCSSLRIVSTFLCYYLCILCHYSQSTGRHCYTL